MTVAAGPACLSTAKADEPTYANVLATDCSSEVCGMEGANLVQAGFVTAFDGLTSCMAQSGFC